MEGLQKIAKLDGDVCIPNDNFMVFTLNEMSCGEGEGFKMWAIPKKMNHRY